MIYARLELWPLGDRRRARILGEATVTNDGQGSLLSGGKLGDYRVALSKFGGFKARKNQEARRVHNPLVSSIWRRVTLQGFDRKARGTWDLLAVALVAACKGRRAGSGEPGLDRGSWLDTPDGPGLVVAITDDREGLGLHVEGMADWVRGATTPGGGTHVGGGVVWYTAKALE